MNMVENQLGKTVDNEMDTAEMQGLKAWDGLGLATRLAPETH